MSDDKILKEIDYIKKLLILHLLKSGASTGEVRKILKMGGSRFSEFMPVKKPKKYK